jgi:hypothetical protein
VFNRPLFVAWTSGPDKTVTFDGRPITLHEQDALVMWLTPAPAGRTVAPGSVIPRVVDATAPVPLDRMTAGILGSFLNQPNAFATLEFDLASRSWKTVTLVNALPERGPEPPAGVSVFNFQTGTWDSITLAGHSSAVVPDPADHLSANGALFVRVQTSSVASRLGTISIRASQSGAP